MEKIIDRFLELFYKISQIPRKSGKEERFADFLEMFAKENNLKCYRDKSNNVLIKKCGNKKDNETVILQAHMDMVCVKNANSNHNFDIDPIKIIKNGDVISAKDTSLGADQGIGIAIMLLILESSKIKHPDLECLFTTEEETTFNGAINFDYSKLNKDELIKHIAKFTSSIWQVHPFGEGNTRTTAVFIEKYLNNMGFDVNNDMFKEHSLYFRNALVRSNYGNIPRGIYPTFDYLIMFFENLLQGKSHKLKNRDLYIKELFKNDNS